MHSRKADPSTLRPTTTVRRIYVAVLVVGQDSTCHEPIKQVNCNWWECAWHTFFYYKICSTLCCVWFYTRYYILHIRRYRIVYLHVMFVYCSGVEREMCLFRFKSVPLKTVMFNTVFHVAYVHTIFERREIWYLCITYLTNNARTYDVGAGAYF